jgi:hypothetical protein
LGCCLLSGYYRSWKKTPEAEIASGVFGLLVSGRASINLPEAIAAIHWAIASGTEWYFGLFSTLGANDGEHFPLSSTKSASAISSLAATGLPAFRATFRLVGIALLGMKCLIVSAEDK